MVIKSSHHYELANNSLWHAKTTKSKWLGPADKCNVYISFIRNGFSVILKVPGGATGMLTWDLKTTQRQVKRGQFRGLKPPF